MASRDAGQAEKRRNSSSGLAELGVERSQWVVGRIYPVIKGKLSFTAHRNDEHTLTEIKRQPALFFFSSDLQERYEPYCADFGPVNLGVVYRFCRLIQERMEDPRLKNRHLVYYTDECQYIRSNTAFLLGAYLVLVEKWTPEMAALPFAAIQPTPFRPFRDATYLPSDFPMTLFDCFSALAQAVRVGWFDLEDFDVEDYEFWDHPLNGDLHQHCTKFIAFKGPSGRRERIGPDVYTFTPQDYVQVFCPHFKGLHMATELWTKSGNLECLLAPVRLTCALQVFKEKGVTAVVRLNESDTYNGQDFEKAGIHHYDLYFDDCTVPPDDIVTRFLDLCDSESGVIAVHCKAGLGRTGTLIALWIMKHYGFNARQLIAWLRIVRPGSIIGPQQQYLTVAERGTFEGNKLILPTDGGAQTSADESASLARQVAEGMNLRAVQRR